MAAKKNAKKSAAKLDMAAIVSATNSGSFVYTSPEAHASALADGLVEVNPSMSNDAGELATRATEKGIASMNAPAAKPSFAIEDNVPLTPVSGRGRTGETYPFDLLQVGQSFFVPNPEGKVDKEGKPVLAAKSLASTVSSATRRYAEEIPGETRTNRKGETVPALRETRKFVLRAVEGGARVWRTQ